MDDKELSELLKTLTGTMQRVETKLDELSQFTDKLVDSNHSFAVTHQMMMPLFQMQYQYIASLPEILNDVVMMQTEMKMFLQNSDKYVKINDERWEITSNKMDNLVNKMDNYMEFHKSSMKDFNTKWDNLVKFLNKIFGDDKNE